MTTASSKPLVSIIITSYNCGEYLEKTIESVEAQTYRPIEVIISDNGSTDGTRERVQQLSSKYKKVFPDTGHAVAVARNAGLAIAQGKYVNFLDGDDLFLPDKIAYQVEAAETSPEDVITYCDVLLADEHGRLYDPLSTITSFPSGWIAQDLLGGAIIPVHSPLVPRRVLDEIGPLDESLHIVDDWDLWVRASTQFPFLFLPKALAAYRRHRSNITSGVPRFPFGSRLKRAFRHAEMEITVRERYLTSDIFLSASPQTQFTYANHLARLYLTTGKNGGVNRIAPFLRMTLMGRLLVGLSFLPPSFTRLMIRLKWLLRPPFFENAIRRMFSAGKSRR